MTTTLPGSERDVDVHSMKVCDMQLLTAPAKTKNGNSIKTILTNCLETPHIQVDTLLTCDCNALLLAVRRATFGDDYDFTTACLSCNKSGTYTVDLAQLEPKQGDQKLVRRQLQDPQALHPYTFPECGRTARFHLCTGLNTQSTQTAGQELLDTLTRRIVSVDGLKETGMPLKVFLRDELSAGDAIAFLEHYADVEPGFDDQVQLACPKCGGEFEITLPLEANGFFRRSKRKSSGKPSSASPAKVPSASESTCRGSSATN